MPIFFRGAGLGTYWHPANNDARLHGFTPHVPGMARSHNRLMQHIAEATTSSPYVSLTRSWGVALSYALNGRAPATQTDPAYIYEIEIDDPLPLGLVLLDPVKEVVNAVPLPTGMPYQHDGSPDFLLGVVDPIGQQQFLNQVRPHPPGGVSRPPNLSLELTTIVRTLRDAEIIVVGVVPANCVTGCNPCVLGGLSCQMFLRLIFEGVSKSVLLNIFHRVHSSSNARRSSKPVCTCVL